MVGLLLEIGLRMSELPTTAFAAMPGEPTERTVQKSEVM
jgi:hypothetical protein